MIPAAEIAGIVDVCVRSIRRRSRDARAFDQGELVNEAWKTALEALPTCRRAGAPLGPYLGFAILRSLRKAIAHWTTGLFEELPMFDTIDPSPSAETILVARSEAARALAALSDLDREIVGELLGTGGRRAAEATDVARSFGVPVGRVYQARQMLSRRAGVRGVPRPGRFYEGKAA